MHKQKCKEIQSENAKKKINHKIQVQKKCKLKCKKHADSGTAHFLLFWKAAKTRGTCKQHANKQMRKKCKQMQIYWNCVFKFLGGPSVFK